MKRATLSRIVLTLFISFLWIASAQADCNVSDSQWVTENGGCEDVARGVVWSNDGSLLNGGATDYATASAYCANLVEDGIGGWSLPSVTQATQAASDGIGNHITLAEPSTTYALWWPVEGSSKMGTGVELYSGQTQKFIISGSTLFYVCARVPGGGGGGHHK